VIGGGDLGEGVAVEEVERRGCFLVHLDDSQRRVKAARPFQDGRQTRGRRRRVPLHDNDLEGEGGGAAAEQYDLVQAVLQPDDEIALVAVVARGENNRQIRLVLR
jgi:hypothetical protein